MTKKVELKVMGLEGFDAYRQQGLLSYAEDKKKSLGISHQEAIKLATQSDKDLLPEGMQTPGHHFFEIQWKSKKIGILWFAIRKEWGKSFAFVYDFELEQAYRGQGLGFATLEAMQEEIKQMGIPSVSLHVFGHNEVALHLYKKFGFEVQDIVMTKNL